MLIGQRLLARLTVLIYVVALQMGVVSMSGVTALAAEPTPSESGATTEEASVIHYRESLGFRSDLEYVRSVAADPANYPAELSDIPLSKAESAEVLRRMEVQWATMPAMEYANAEPDFAGGYIDQLGGGVPIFLFTGRLDAHADNIAKVLATPIEFRVEQAERSLDELLSEQAAIDEQRPRFASEGVDIVETAILPDRNAVVVGINGLTAAREAAVTDLFGPGLVFEDSRPARADCVNGGNCRPIKGGLAIDAADGGECTSGFVVKQSGSSVLRLLTAGHCLAAHGGETVVWRHNADSFGRALKDTWQENYTRTADVGLISINSDDLALMTNDNAMHRGAGYVYPVIDQLTGDNQMLNGQAYRYGRNSGTDPGLINGLYANRQSCWGSLANPNCMTVTKTIRVDFDSVGGDSGGPVWFYLNLNPGLAVIALGTHVHSENEIPGPYQDPQPWWGWYSPIDVGAAQYLANWSYSYTLCKTANC